MVLYFYSPPNTFFLSLFPLPLENDMATHSSIRAWEVAWTEESGGLQSGARVVHDWATKPIPLYWFPRWLRGKKKKLPANTAKH